MSSSLVEIVDALRAYAEWQSATRPHTREARIQEPFFEDRRAHVRLRPIQLDRPMLARLKPGPLLTLIDVSAGGALIQTPARLTPGAHVIIEFLAPGSRRAVVLRSRIVRSHVAGLDGCVRYRGACSFDEMLELGEFLPAAGGNINERLRTDVNFEVHGPPASLVASPTMARTGIAELLDDLNMMRAAHASPPALMAHVDGWLRRHVPLLGVRVNPAGAGTLRAGDVLSFRMPAAYGSGSPSLCVEFQPACALNESQRKLLAAGAYLMTLLYTTARHAVMA